MFYNERGTIFVGFTDQRKCGNCNNEVNFQLRQEYDAFNFAMLVSMPIYSGDVSMVCPVCERSVLVMQKGWLLDEAKKAAGKKRLKELFDGGRDYTKYWVNKKLSPSDRVKALKRLNSLEQYELVKFIEGA